ncbi:hypothetical protein ACWDA3_49800 [Nonomuraea rubra]
MSLEIVVHCEKPPDPQALARVAGFVMRTVLDVTNIEIQLDDEGDRWSFHWGGAGKVVAYVMPPGEQWWVFFEPGTREPVPKLLMIILAAVGAVLSDGTLDDDNYPFERVGFTPEALLSQVLRESPLGAESAVHLLVTGRLP